MASPVQDGSLAFGLRPVLVWCSAEFTGKLLRPAEVSPIACHYFPTRFEDTVQDR